MNLSYPLWICSADHIYPLGLPFSSSIMLHPNWLLVDLVTFCLADSEKETWPLVCARQLEAMKSVMVQLCSDEIWLSLMPGDA